MKEIVIVLLDRFADWEAAFLAPALRGGVMPGHPPQPPPQIKKKPTHKHHTKKG